MAGMSGMAALGIGGAAKVSAGASVVVTDAMDSAGNNTPSTGLGISCCSAENSLAWDIARSAEFAPEGAEDGCKKFTRGFPLPRRGQNSERD